MRLEPLLQREDLRALAVVLLECILSALARSGPSQLTSAESIQVRHAWQLPPAWGCRHLLSAPRCPATLV